MRRRVCRTRCITAGRTCVRRLKRQIDEHPSSCWSVEVRSPHVNQRHDFSSMVGCGDLRQHNFQRSNGGVDAYSSGLVRLVLMSSPCTVAATSFPLMRRHACRTSCIAAAHTRVRHLAGSPQAAVRRTLFFVPERRSTPSARRPVPLPFHYVRRGDLRKHNFQRFQRRC